MCMIDLHLKYHHEQRNRFGIIKIRRQDNALALEQASKCRLDNVDCLNIYFHPVDDIDKVVPLLFLNLVCLCLCHGATHIYTIQI